MDGKDFLLVAKLLLQQHGEEFWRTAAGRAYYALLLEGRELLRRWADYELALIPAFNSPMAAQAAVQRAEQNLTLLQQMEADPARVAAAVAAIRAAFP